MRLQGSQEKESDTNLLIGHQFQTSQQSFTTTNNQWKPYKPVHQGGVFTTTSTNKSLKIGGRNFVMQQNSTPDHQTRQPYNSIQGMNASQQLTINSNDSVDGAINLHPYQSQTSTNTE